MGAAEMKKFSILRCRPLCELVWVWPSGAESALLLELPEELSWVCFTSSRGLVMTAVILTTCICRLDCQARAAEKDEKAKKERGRMKKEKKVEQR